MRSRILRSLVPILLVTAFAPALCRAQQEINPDHFDDPSTAATAVKKAASNQAPTQAYGNFFLPFDATCAGVKLTRGYYSLSIRQSGKLDVVRLTRMMNGARAQAIELTATPRLGAEGPGGLVVNRVNQRRTLTAISLQQSGVTLFLQPEKQSAISVSAELIPFSFSTGQMLPANGE